MSHRYFLVDDSIFYEDHIETDAKDNAAVENLALGDAEYYKSVETASGHTLYASNYSDVKAAVAYYLDGGSDYAEVMIDPAYLATPSDFLQAYKDVTGKSCGYGTSYSRSGQIFLIHYKK